MQIGSRFTEYGLTGGFFWICQILFFMYTGQAKTWLSYLSKAQRPPDWIWQIGSTAITTVAIIAVFCGRAAARSKSLARTCRRAPASQTIKEFLHALKPSR
jgi:hypothetical protein